MNPELLSTGKELNFVPVPAYENKVLLTQYLHVFVRLNIIKSKDFNTSSSVS